MEIRLATREDIEPVFRLYKTLFADMSRLQPYSFREADQDRAFLNHIFEDEQADIWVAAENDRLAGFAVVQEQTTPPYICLVPYRYAYLMDLVVAPLLRGMGVGTSLLDAVKQWAEKRGLEYVELSVLAENEPAISLYERENFGKVMHTMRFLIEPKG